MNHISCGPKGKNLL